MLLAERPLALSQRVVARVGRQDATIVDDLNFLAAWETGRVPWWSGALRMRQLWRANPAAPHPAPLGRPGLP